jgi:hypothetical protein
VSCMAVCDEACRYLPCRLAVARTTLGAVGFRIILCRGHKGVAATAAVLVLAGCGTTVPSSRTPGSVGDGNGNGGLGAAAPGGAESTGVGGQAGIVGPKSPRTGTGRAGAAGVNRLSDPASGSGVGGAAGDSAAGVTATTISIGVGYTSNGDAADAALGAANVTQGDGKADAQAVINDINRNGGVAGRKIVPVWNSENAQSTSPRATQEQQWCANYTQDHHVFAAIDFDAGDHDLVSCLTKTALLIGDDEAAGPLVGFDQRDFTDYPYFVDPATLELDSEAEAEVPLLVRQGYFTAWNPTTGSAGATAAKVAVIGLDLPAWNQQIDQVLLPLLARNRIQVDPEDVFRIYDPPSSAQDDTTVADIQNATLKMRSDGVTHVIDLDANGALTLLFANDAYSQHYYPRLGINTAAGLQALQGDIQPASENGAEGLGWYPVLDLPSSAAGDSSNFSSATRRHCAAVLKAAGITFTSTNAEAVALTYCDDLYFIQRVLNSTATVTRDSFITAVNQLTSPFPAAQFPLMRLGPNRHYGVSQGWDMRYVSSCQCVRYFGHPFNLP